MLIGYMRVSKADGSQSTDLQRDALKAAGVATRRLYEDRASGRLDARPGLDAALKALRRGDTLIVWKLDRLGRDLRHLINVIHDLSTRSIGFKVLTGHGASIDTTTPAGKLVFGIFAALAEYAEPAVMRSDAIEVEVWPAGWPLGAPHNIQRYGPQRFRDCGEVHSKDWTVWPEPGAQPVRAGLDLSWLKGPGLCVARQTDITFETVRNRAVFCTGSNSRLRITAGSAYSAFCREPQNAEFERDLISERTKAGLASARARGRKGGAPFKMTAAKVRLAMAAMGQRETKVTDLCSELAITRQTLYRHVAPDGTLRKDGLKVVEGGKIRSGKKK